MQGVDLEALGRITLHPKMIFKYGDRPFFASELNRLILQDGPASDANASASPSSSSPSSSSSRNSSVFVKYKIAEDAYQWSRVLEVLEEAIPYPWHGKHFRIKFHVEDRPELISCAAVSSKPVSGEDVRAYLTRQAQAKAPPPPIALRRDETARGENLPGLVEAAANAEASSLPPVAESVPSDTVTTTTIMRGGEEEEDRDLVLDETLLPNAVMCEAVEKAIQNTITRRPLSESDVVALREYATTLNAFPGNLAVMHTNTTLANMRDETKVGHTTSYHQVGVSSKAHTRRLGDRALQQQQQQQEEQEQQLQQSAGSALMTFSQASLGGFETQVNMASQRLMSPMLSQSPLPNSPSQCSQGAVGDASRWMQAKHNEDVFHDYISSPDRSGFVDFLADKTKYNAALNARATVLAMSKGQKQKSNMIESSGLWITDDKLRVATAQEFLNGKNEGGEKKKDDDKPKATGKPSTAVPGAAAVHASTASSTTARLHDELLSALSSQQQGDGSLSQDDDDWTSTVSSSSNAALASSSGIPPRHQLILHASKPSPVIFSPPATAVAGGDAGSFAGRKRNRDD